MKSFSQFRKNQYTEAAQKANCMESLHCYLEVLRLNLKEAVALPDLMLENFVDQTEYHVFKEQDSKLNNQIIDLSTNYAINSLYEEILREAETIAVPQNLGGNQEAAKKALIAFKQQLLAKIKQLVTGLKQTVMGSVSQGRSIEPEAAPAPSGSSAPAPSGGSEPSGGSASARSSMDRPAYGTERPADDSGFKPAAYGSMRPADGWLAGLRRTLVDPVMNSRPVKWLRQKWHGDKHRESVEAMFAENTSQLDAAFDTFEKDLAGWLDQNVATVAKTIGVELGTSQPQPTAKPGDVTAQDAGQPGPNGPDVPVNTTDTSAGSAAATDPAILTGDAPELHRAAAAGDPEAQKIEFSAYNNARKGLESIGYDIHTTQGWGKGKKPKFAFDQFGKKDAAGNLVLAQDLIKKMSRKEVFNNIIKSVYAKLGGQHGETSTPAEMWADIAGKLNGLSYEYGTQGIADRLTDLILRFGAHQNGATLAPAQRHEEPVDDHTPPGQMNPAAAAAAPTGPEAPVSNSDMKPVSTPDIKPSAPEVPQADGSQAPQSDENSVQEVMDLIVKHLGQDQDNEKNRETARKNIEKIGLEATLDKVRALIAGEMAQRNKNPQAAPPEVKPEAPTTPSEAPVEAPAAEVPEAEPEAPAEAPKPEPKSERPPTDEQSATYIQKLAQMHQGDNKAFYADLSDYMIDRLEKLGVPPETIKQALKALKEAGIDHRDAEKQYAWAAAAREILHHHQVEDAVTNQKASDDELNQLTGGSESDAAPTPSGNSSGLRDIIMKRKKANESFSEYAKRLNQAFKENLSDDSNIQRLRKRLFSAQ